MDHTARSLRTIRLHTAALLAATLACCVAGGPVAASSNVIGGYLTNVYSFNGGSPDGQIPLDSFEQSSSVSGVNDTAQFAYTSNPAQITQSGQIDARAGFGSVGLSGHTSYALAPPRHVNSPGYNTIQATGVAIGTFTDVLVTGPGSGNVATRLRVHLSGHLNSTSSDSLATDGIVGASSMSFGVSVNGSLVGFGNLGRNSVNGRAPEVTADGLLVGFDGDAVLTTNTFVIPLNTSLTVQLRLQMGLQSRIQDSVQGIASSSASFGDSLSFATDRPVFDLPAGHTANSPSGGIVNNIYQTVPEPGTTALLLLAAPAALLRRRRRAEDTLAEPGAQCSPSTAARSTQ